MRLYNKADDLIEWAVELPMDDVDYRPASRHVGFDRYPMEIQVRLRVRPEV